MKVEEPQRDPSCAACGALLEEDVKFCTSCGTKVEEKDEA